MDECRGCQHLAYEPPCKEGDCYSAHCTDPDKPVMGSRRVVAVGWRGYPVNIQRPAWCRRKEKT